MAIGLPDLVCRQLSGGGPDQQGPRVGRIIDPHHVDQGLGRLHEMQSVPPPYSHRSSFDREGRLFIGAALWPLCPRVQHRPMHRRPAALARSSRSGRPAQRGVSQLTACWDKFTQPAGPSESWERIGLGRRGKLLKGGDAGIHAKQALICTCGKITKESGDRFFTALAEPGATDQADPDTANQHDAGQGSDDVGAYGSPCLLAVAFNSALALRERGRAIVDESMA